MTLKTPTTKESPESPADARATIAASGEEIVTSALDPEATATTRGRYDRIARVYDRMGSCSERRLERPRKEQWRRVRGPRVLEVGVGTGRSFPLYPAGMEITAVDLSPRMLDRARSRAAELGTCVDLREADAQALPFADGSFDSVVATCVFCSVPDPVLGLSEIRRVLVPGGQVLLLEHVLSHKPVLGTLMRLLNPLVVRVVGANINRETVTNVEHAGFVDLQVEDVWLDIVKLIEARSPIENQDNG